MKRLGPLLAVVLILVVAVCSGCDFLKPKTPSETVKAFYTAVSEGNYSEAEKYLSLETRAVFGCIGAVSEALGGPGIEELLGDMKGTIRQIVIGGEEIREDRAEVRCSLYLKDGEVDTFTQVLRKRVTWKIVWESPRWLTESVVAPVSNLGSKAADFAKQVLGAPYLWGGKGWDWKEGKFVDSNIIKEGYHWNWEDRNEVGKGIDCSGLVYWAYNKAGEANRYQDLSNPIYYEGADGQWKHNVEQLSTKIPQVSDLKLGFLLFLDTPDRGFGIIDHVGMYVGNGYVVHSRGDVGVERKSLSDWINISLPDGKRYRNYFVGYGRVKL